MNAIEGTAGDWDTFLETLAAEFTDAAYPIALRHGTAGTWIDLELDLWRVLTATVQKWGRDSLRSGQPFTFKLREAALLAELTEAAHRAALRQGIKGSFRHVELDLYRALRSVIEEVGRKARVCRDVGNSPRSGPLPAAPSGY